MSDGSVIPFRRRPLEQPAVWSDGRVQAHCDEHVHLFASVPGRCQCGERLWETLPDSASARDVESRQTTGGVS